MKKKFRSATLKKAMWPVSIIAVALCLLLSINAYAATVNITSYGAIANDGIADNAAIQSAINACGSGGTVIVPSGTFNVDAVNNKVLLNSNMTLNINSGGIIKALANDQQYYEMLTINGKTNVTITGGGTIEGERHEHTVPGDYINKTNGEWGMGIRIGNSSHIYVSDITVSECWGDGIYIGGGLCTDIKLTGVICDDNRRQGCSVTHCDGFVFQNCTFKNTAGTAPSAGVDIEPWGAVAHNGQIINCHFDNNAGNGAEMLGHDDGSGSEIQNISVTGCTMSNNTWAGFCGTGYGTGIVVTDNVISDSKKCGGILLRGAPSSGGIFRNNHIYHTIALEYSNQSGIEIISDATGNTIQNNDVHGNYYAAVRDDVGGNTISGNTLNAPGSRSISVTPTSLNFGNVPVDTSPADKTYTVEGSNLTADVTLNTPAGGYTISTSSGSGFVSSLTLPRSGGNLANTTIYVRFTPTAVQVYNGNITNASTGVSTMNVALTGSGTTTGTITDASAAKKAVAPITIDGSLSECDWVNANSSAFTNEAQSNNMVKVSTLWDDTNLYLAYEVMDGQIETPAVSIWSQDAIELYLDAGHEKSDDIDANDYQFIISATNEIGYFHAAVGKTIQKAVTTTGSGYIVEMAVPWAQIGTTPVVGTVLGALFCNDDSDAGVSKSFDWMNLRSTGGFARPNLWGDITLSGTGACSTTGIGVPNKIENVIVSPNPFHTNFKIQISSGLPIRNAWIKIYDICGKEVKTVLINQYAMTISRNGMENGIYFYSILNNNNQIANGKLIVQ